MSGVGRNSFTLNDDKEMLKFLIAELTKEKPNPDAKNPKGNEIWKLAEKKKITTKSYQSMNSRFRRIILPQLDLQPITKEDKDFLKLQFGIADNKAVKSVIDKKVQQVLDVSDEISSDSFDEDEPVSETKYKGKRIPFTEEDDVKMLSFLKQEIKKHNLKTDQPFGTKLWTKAFEERVTDHSALSMQTRFTRILQPKLNELKHVPDDIITFLNQRMVQKTSGDRYETASSAGSPEKSDGSGAKNYRPRHKNQPKKVIQPIDDDEMSSENDETPPKRVAKGSKSTSNKDEPGPSRRRSLPKAKTGTDDDDETEDEVQPGDEDLMKIMQNGGALSNELRFKSVVFDHIYRGTFETREEVKIFTNKFRLIEAFSVAYDIPVAEILPIIKTCENDLIRVENFLHARREAKKEIE